MKIKLIYLFSCFFTLSNLHPGKAQDRPQTPIEPFAYKSIEVAYQVKTDTSVHLAATLTIPEGKGKFPAILIIGGSGQTHRDQPYHNHRMMLVLSDFLTKQGFATLRFDDRGAGKSTAGTKKYNQLVESDYLADAAAGIDFLKNHASVDPNKIGIIGHSAGATQGLILASDADHNIQFSIMLAGAVNNYPHLIVAQQSKLMAKAANRSQSIQTADSTFVSKSSYHTINEPIYEKRLAAIKSIAEDELSHLSPAEQAIVKKSFDTRVNILSSEQFHVAAREKKVDYLLKVKCPVLILLGDKDLNVDANYYGAQMSKSMKKNYNKKSKLYILPGINHLMQFSKTGLSEESKDITETINQKILELIGDWLSKITP